MSGPYISQIGGAGQLSPAPGPRPGPRAMPGINGVDLSGVNFLPGVVPNVRLNGKGLPLASQVNTEMPSNTFYSASYVVNKLKNGSENTLIPSMLVFTERKETELKLGAKESVPTHTLISIGELNYILWNAYTRVMASSRDRDPKALGFLRAMRYIPEDKLSRYASLMSDPSGKRDQIEMMRRDVETPGAAQGPAGNDDDMLHELYTMCMQNSDFALVACPQMIMNRFSFAGVVRNRSDNEMLDTQRMRTAALVINTVNSHLTEIHDVFLPTREMHVGARLFLHYTRRVLPQGVADPDIMEYNYGPFVVVPLCSYNQGRPPVLGSYRDMAGVRRTGLLHEIGTIRHMKSRDDSVITQNIAAGIDPSLDMEQVKRATVRLATVEANLFLT